jgi:hypothetical protein
MSSGEHGRALLAMLKGGDASKLEELTERERVARAARAAEEAARVAAVRAEHERLAAAEHAAQIEALAGEREREPIERDASGVVPIVDVAAEVREAFIALGLVFGHSLAALGGEWSDVDAWASAADEAVTRARVALESQPYDGHGRELASLRAYLVNLRWAMRERVERARVVLGAPVP